MESHPAYIKVGALFISYKIMQNMINSGSLESLQTGQSLLVQAVATTTDKVQLEIAEKLEQSGGGGNNLLSMFNKSDSRFDRKPRRAWMTVEAADAEQLLGLEEGTLTSDEGWVETTVGRGTTKYVRPLNILNPHVGVDRLVVQITESTQPTEWQAANMETAAKRRGADGEYITHNGQYIFSNEDIVLEKQRNHVFLEADAVSVAVKVDPTTGEIFN